MRPLVVCAVFCAKRSLVDHFRACGLRFHIRRFEYSGGSVKSLASDM